MREQLSREKWKQYFHTMSHPSDGFYWIRHANLGSVAIAVITVILFSVCFSVNRMSASFIVNDVNPRSVDTLTELSGVLALFMLLCVGNWSVTCLMEGEGRFKDIIVAVGYSLLPMAVSMAVSTLVSFGVAENEEAFYYIILALGIGYGFILMLVGVMQVHGYTLGKTLITMFLTFVAIFIMLFLILLLGNFISMVVSFFRSLYIEIIFRI